MELAEASRRNLAGHNGAMMHYRSSEDHPCREGCRSEAGGALSTGI